MDRDAMIRLLCEILRGTAVLADAVCRGRGALFDDVITESTTDRAERLTAALALCHRCPVRVACATVLPPATQRWRGGVGVQAGMVLAGPSLDRPAVA